MTLQILSLSLGRLLDLFLPRTSKQLALSHIEAIDLLTEVRRCQNNSNDYLSVFSYQEPLIKTAIWQIKYRNDKQICEMLAGILFEFLVEELSDLNQFQDFHRPILIPIPMGMSRKRERGYNQTENLATEMKKLDVNGIFDLSANILKKIRETEPQSSLKRTLRLQNLRQAFKVPIPAMVHNRNIILLDDVITTGSTILECKRVLIEAGAKKVIGLSVAH